MPSGALIPAGLHHGQQGGSSPPGAHPAHAAAQHCSPSIPPSTTCSSNSTSPIGALATAFFESCDELVQGNAAGPSPALAPGPAPALAPSPAVAPSPEPGELCNHACALGHLHELVSIKSCGPTCRTLQTSGASMPAMLT